MYFYLIGINYKRATIDAREELYRHQKAISGFWACCASYETAVLLTCNRIEIYGVARCADDAFGNIAVFFRDFPDFSKYAYVKFGEAQVFRHALRLSLGLESQLNGEGEILTQLNTWKATCALPFLLEALWDKAIFLAKKIHNVSGVGGDAGNIATLIFGDIAERMGPKEMYKIIVIGTGKIAELFARQRPPKAHLIFVARKNYQKARMLAECSGGEVLLLDDFSRVIFGADIVVSATSSLHYVLKKEHFVKDFLRRTQPLYIYDLAIPRDVEPVVGGIDGVYLYNLDSLEYLFCRYNKSVQDRVELVSDLIEDELGAYQEVVYDKAY